MLPTWHDPAARRQALALLPTLMAMCWAALLVGAAALPLDGQRGLVFVGGPVLALAGLHARLAAYLHDPARVRLLSLPVEAGAHWRAGRVLHRRGLAWTVALGVGALALGVGVSVGARGGLDRALEQGLWLTADFLCFALFAALCEPLIPGLSSWAGRRFPEEHAIANLQRQLGGGWTTREAVVHLYAPALGLGLAAALAMPGQLALARLAGGATLHVGHTTWVLVAAALAVLGRLLAPHLYARGLWRAAPRLAEAIRTLAGPPTPPPAPRWVARMGQLAGPATELAALQLVRLSPLVGLRFAALLTWTGYVTFRAAPPTLIVTGVTLVLASAWLAAGAAQRRERPHNARALAPLPLPVDTRQGAARALDLALYAPPTLAALAVIVRMIVNTDAS